MTGFVMIPFWLLNKKPTGNDVLVYGNLAKFGTWNPGTGRYAECRPSIARLCRETDLSESSVRRSLKNLVKLGAAVPLGARYDEDGGQLPTVYEVVFGAVVEPPPVTDDSPPPVTGGTPGVSPVEPNQEPNTKNQDTKKKAPSASPRGTRLPEGFWPSDEMILWARTNAPGIGWSEHEKFVDYWIAQPGQKGVKTDWPATWRNWMRRAAEDRGARPVSGGPTGAKPFAQKSDEYKAVKVLAKPQIALLAQKLIDEQGLKPSEAMAQAEMIFAKELDQAKASTTRTDFGYSEAEVVDAAGPREVTGS